VLRSEDLSAHCGRNVFLKLENVQLTGSFKVRGALNRLLAMHDAERARGVVAASSGNHGLGVAYAARALGCQATVFVPATAAPEKRQAIEALGAAVQAHGDDCVQTEAHARAVAGQDGRTYVPPYNDLLVAAGQGSIAVELLHQLPELDAVYVALGGGGLIAGIAAHLKVARPGLEVVAVSPVASPAMDECVRRGRIVDVACGPTLSDSTAGGVEPGAVTFGLCQQLVDRYLRVGEDDIARCMRWSLLRQHLLVEGAAALAVAGCALDWQRRGRLAAVLVCGANVPSGTLRRVLAEDDGDPALPGQ
jgi:threonine dehydratase